MRAIETPTGQAEYQKKRFNKAYNLLKVIDPQFKDLSRSFRLKMKDLMYMARGLIDWQYIPYEDVFWYQANCHLPALRDKVWALPADDRYNHTEPIKKAQAEFLAKLEAGIIKDIRARNKEHSKFKTGAMPYRV